MLKHLFFKSALVFLSFTAIAQKKHYYFDEDKNPITKTEYNKIDEWQGNLLKLDYDLDTIFYHVIEKREQWGSLTKDSMENIRKYISQLTTKQIPPQHIIVINYLHGKDKCNTSGDFKGKKKIDAWYQKEIKKYKKLTQVNMYLADGIERYTDSLWVHDKQKKISAFFNHQHYPCGSFIIFYPDGNYYLFKGEYSPEQVLDKLDS